MTYTRKVFAGICAIVGAALLFAAPPGVHATIDGVTGPSFNLTAGHGHISTPDGGSVLFWGYGAEGSIPQYPGPTLIVNQGDTVTVNLTVANPDPYIGNDRVSILFPGQTGVTSAGGVPGALVSEAEAGTPVTYTFTASQPGTFTYHSGTETDLQVEMGLFGTLIVRPTMGDQYVYDHPDTGFDREYLFLLSEIDPVIHNLVESGNRHMIDTTKRLPVYWFINGRAGPDTLLPAFVPYLPTQPYNCLPRMLPGEKLLLRVVNGGSDLHPFHHHGNHATVLGRYGRMLSSDPVAGPDLANQVFTIQSVPGETVDAIFEWTGQGLGWDIYGDPTDPLYAHDCIDGDADDFDDTTSEYCPDHGKEFPVVIPENQDLAFGGFWSGSPFMGQSGGLPPGEGGLNPNSGFTFMWHSHAEKELVNFDIFPGGMMTLMYVEPPGTVIP